MADRSTREIARGTLSSPAGRRFSCARDVWSPLIDELSSSEGTSVRSRLLNFISDIYSLRYLYPLARDQSQVPRGPRGRRLTINLVPVLPPRFFAREACTMSIEVTIKRSRSADPLDRFVGNGAPDATSVETASLLGTARLTVVRR